MSIVPEIPKFKPTKTNTTIYCFKPGATEEQKQHDIEQVNKFIDHIKAKRKAKK